MLLLEIFFLAVVQGIGEFLPISSSGHVVVGAALCDQWGHPIHEKLALNVVLHLGTLLSVLVFFFKRWLKVVLEEPRV
ncbi:MAG TPA: undecaprenyl-diphosphate phosphatase, partial [Thermoguttaceae bacterium]|nr:undecaprenyl-diphosphate phosphatase [Thermoguttaceae bacterium]